MLLIAHVAVVVLCVLNAVAMDSGGSGTEFLFRAFWWIGWLTLLVTAILMVRAMLKKRLDPAATALLVVLAVLGFLETRSVVSDALMLRSILG